MNGKITYDTISKFYNEKFGCKTQTKEMQNNITGEIYNVIFEEGADVALFSMKDNRYVLLDSKGDEVKDDLIFCDMNGAYVGYEKDAPVFEEKWLSLKYKDKDIDVSEDVNDLTVPPSNHLEILTGDRKGQYSIRINDQYRICFDWVEDNALNVEITDYHG